MTHYPISHPHIFMTGWSENKLRLLVLTSESQPLGRSRINLPEALELAPVEDSASTLEHATSVHITPANLVVVGQCAWAGGMLYTLQPSPWQQILARFRQVNLRVPDISFPSLDGYVQFKSGSYLLFRDTEQADTERLVRMDRTSSGWRGTAITLAPAQAPGIAKVA